MPLRCERQRADTPVVVKEAAPLANTQLASGLLPLHVHCHSVHLQGVHQHKTTGVRMPLHMENTLWDSPPLSSALSIYWERSTPWPLSLSPHSVVTGLSDKASATLLRRVSTARQYVQEPQLLSFPDCAMRRSLTLTGTNANFFARTPAPTERILSPSQKVVTSGNSTPVDCSSTSGLCLEVPADAAAHEADFLLLILRRTSCLAKKISLWIRHLRSLQYTRQTVLCMSPLLSFEGLQAPSQ